MLVVNVTASTKKTVGGLKLSPGSAFQPTLLCCKVREKHQSTYKAAPQKSPEHTCLGSSPTEFPRLARRTQDSQQTRVPVVAVFSVL